MSMNRTEGCDSPNRPDEAIDEKVDDLLERTDDAIRVRRPAGLTDERWAMMCREITAELDYQVEIASGRCRTFAWCVMAGDPDEHEQFHSGETVDLAGVGVELCSRSADEKRPQGWWAYAVHDRQNDSAETKLVFEGRFAEGERAECFDVDVVEVAAILAATRNRAGRKALEGLVAAVWSRP